MLWCCVVVCCLLPRLHSPPFPTEDLNFVLHFVRRWPATVSTTRISLKSTRGRKCANVTAEARVPNFEWRHVHDWHNPWLKHSSRFFERTSDAVMTMVGYRWRRQQGRILAFNAKIIESSKIKLLIICTWLTTLFDHAALARPCRTSGWKAETWSKNIHQGHSENTRW